MPTESDNQLEKEMQSLSSENQAAWKAFADSIKPELAKDTFQQPRLKVFQEIFLYGAHICESNTKKSADPISTIRDALKLKPHEELGGLFEEYRPEDFKSIVETFQLNKPDGLGIKIRTHLSQNVDPSLPQRLGEAAF